MDGLAQTCEEIARWNSRLRKVRILAEYLKGLSETDLNRAVRFLCCGPIQSTDRKFSVGGTTLRQALQQASGWDAETLSQCYIEVGDTGETISLLMQDAAAGEPMTLGDAEILYARLYKQKRTVDKIEMLRQIYLRYKPATLKFFVKAITGNLRIGLQAKMVEEAIAEATGTPLEDVRMANNRVSDLPLVAVAARRNRLDEIEARLFHPMEFMLAKPLDSVDGLTDPENWWVEDKYDGFRSQVHAGNGRVQIFTRGMEEVTQAFPEIVTAFTRAGGAAAIDGEILAWRDGRALPFSVLQQRIARRKATEQVTAAVPVTFMAYDIMYLDGRMLISEPIEERRRILETYMQDLGLFVAPQWRSETTGGLEAAFEAARDRGNEGLLIKRAGSHYESGKRSGAWMKIKRPHGALDVVITAAEQGSGRRAIYLIGLYFCGS